MNPAAQQYLEPQLHINTRSNIIPKVAVHEQYRRKLNKLRFVMLATLLLLPLSIGAYIWSQRPYKPSATAILQYQKTVTLQQSYQVCAAEAQQQQNSYDLNDIFMQRQIDATLVRCASLKNQYNYEVDQYNKLAKH